MSNRIHGLRSADWLALYATANWRASIRRALIEIARDSRADADDRLSALYTMSSAMVIGLLPEDYDYPEFSRDVLLSIVDGVKLSWWHRIGRTRHARMCSQRLYAIKCAVHSMHSFETAAKAEQDAAEAAAARTSALVPDNLS
nr:hypothetical protein [Kofleriaceae bacterium]